MRLYTIRYRENECVAVKTKVGKLCTLQSLGFDIKDMNTLIKCFGEIKNDIESRLSEQVAEYVDEQEMKIMAPIPVPMQDIICLGVNYKEHIEETKEAIDFSKKTDAVYFSKRVNRSNDPDEIIPVYDFVDSLDYEVELGVIIGKDAFQISPGEANDYIFGYTIINDVSARNIQMKHQQWYRGKSLDGYTPMGPCIVTSEEIKNVHNLQIQCFVNGEKRQDSNTSCMITTIEDAIAELSQGMTLKAGTIIATGTPGGVAMGMKPPVFLKEGDVVKCVIEDIGELINTVG